MALESSRMSAGVATANRAAASPPLQIGWFIAGSVVGFLIPYVFTSLLELHHDVYYLIYFTVTLVFLALYVKTTGVDLAGLFRRNWHWSLVLGGPVTAFVVFNVVSRGPTPGPTGFYRVFEIFWRGAVYGVVDALLLSAFPGLVALGLLKGHLEGITRKAGYVAATLAMVLVITGAYHLGYQQFREAGIREPELGNVIVSIPVLATAHPAGSILAHASMHIAATVYAYETEVFLPPKTAAP